MIKFETTEVTPSIHKLLGNYKHDGLIDRNWAEQELAKILSEEILAEIEADKNKEKGQ